MRIDALDIDDHILDKIERKHGVRFEEVEEATNSRRRHVRRERGVHKLYGQTEAGRYLIVVLISLGEGVWKILSARDMEPKEVRLYRKAGGR